MKHFHFLFSNLFDTFTALPITVILLRLLLALHGPFRNDWQSFHCNYNTSGSTEWRTKNRPTIS